MRMIWHGHDGPVPPRPRRASTNGAARAAANGQGGGTGTPGGADGDEEKGLRRYWLALGGVPRVLGLVWGTDRLLTAALGVVTIAQSAIPALSVLATQNIIDAVVTAVRTGGFAVPAAVVSPATTVLHDARVRDVVFWVVVQFVLTALGSLLGTLANIAQQLLQEKVALRVQLLIMEHAGTLDLAFFESASFYDQLQQAQREATSRPVQMVSGTFGLVRTALTFFSMIALLLSLGPLLSVIALLAPIPAFISGSRYGWWGYQLMRRQSPARRMMTYMTNLLTTDTYAKELKIFTLPSHFIARFRGLAATYYGETARLITRRYLAGFAWGSLTTVVASGIYLYVALLAAAGRITLGGLTRYTQAASAVQNNFAGLLGGLSGMYEHTLYLSTLFDLLAFTPVMTAPADPVPVDVPFTEGVEFRHVSYHYAGTQRQALRDVSFSVPAGTTVAVVGRNGAGKTTLVKLLARLYDPDEGQILVNGHDVRDYDPAALRAQIGVIFQDYVTYWLSARENIGVGRAERLDDRAAIASAAAKSGADEVIGRLPEGYETTLGKWFEQGHQLSGGEWQKVALARAFMRDAQILILDEPTAALDAEAEYELFLKMKELTRGKTAFFISHRFSTVRLADRIIVLEDGALLEQGTHEELLALGGRYASLFNLQAASYR
jgi:ATP-binding cassette subfamily B protein